MLRVISLCLSLTCAPALAQTPADLLAEASEIARTADRIAPIEVDRLIHAHAYIGDLAGAEALVSLVPEVRMASAWVAMVEGVLDAAGPVAALAAVQRVPLPAAQSLGLGRIIDGQAAAGDLAGVQATLALFPTEAGRDYGRSVLMATFLQTGNEVAARAVLADITDRMSRDAALVDLARWLADAGRIDEIRALQAQVRTSNARDSVDNALLRALIDTVQVREAVAHFNAMTPEARRTGVAVLARYSAGAEPADRTLAWIRSLPDEVERYYAASAVAEVLTVEAGELIGIDLLAEFSTEVDGLPQTLTEFAFRLVDAGRSDIALDMVSMVDDPVWRETVLWGVADGMVASDPAQVRALLDATQTPRFRFDMIELLLRQSRDEALLAEALAIARDEHNPSRRVGMLSRIAVSLAAASL